LVVKCSVCGYESDDLTKHIREHGLTKAFYMAKFPGSRLIDPVRHEELKVKWREQKRLMSEAKRKKKEELAARKEVVKETSTDIITGKYKEYYSKIKQKYIEEYKFTEGPEVEELLFFLVSNRQLQDEYDEMVNHGGGMAVVGGVLDDIRKNNAHIQELLVTLLKFKQSMENAEDIVNLHNETLKNATEYVKKNMGEFVFRCIRQGSLILKSDFTVSKIEDINIGDEIFGLQKEKNYSWILVKQKVLAKHYSGLQEVIRLNVGNKKLFLTPDHKILAARGINAVRQRSYFPAKDCWDRTIGVFNYIKDINTYYKGVLLGIIDSDGHCRQQTDKNHPQWNFKQIYYIYQKVEYKAVDTLLNYLGIRYCKKWQKAYKSTFGDGCFLYTIKTDYSNMISELKKRLIIENDFDLQLGYLAGFCIGDGSVTKTGVWNISQSFTVNKAKCDFLEQILNKMNITYTKNEKFDTFHLNSLKIPVIIKDSKKSALWQERIINKRPFYSIDEFRTRFSAVDGIYPVWDITTETGNFIANGLVVHNCSTCGQVVDMYGFPHPFFEGKEKYQVFSREMWELVVCKKIPIEYAAYVLHTSPEGLINMARLREETIPEIDLDQAERNLVELRTLNEA